MGRMKKTDESLSPLELEIMVVLWKLGSGSVHEVIAELIKNKELAYTTVSTVLRLLEKKSIVESVKDGRTHIYVPLLTKEEYEGFALSQVVSTVFDGAPKMLVKRLLGDDSISAEELAEIRELLDQRQRK
jgi:predicted transcriptional regulator